MKSLFIHNYLLLLIKGGVLMAILTQLAVLVRTILLHKFRFTPSATWHFFGRWPDILGTLLHPHTWLKSSIYFTRVSMFLLGSHNWQLTIQCMSDWAIFLEAYCRFIMVVPMVNEKTEQCWHYGWSGQRFGERRVLCATLNQGNRLFGKLHVPI